VHRLDHDYSLGVRGGESDEEELFPCADRVVCDHDGGLVYVHDFGFLAADTEAGGDVGAGWSWWETLNVLGGLGAGSYF